MLLFDFDEITNRLGCDPADTLALLKRGGIPQPVIIADRLVRWPSNHFLGWIGGQCKPCDPPSREMYEILRDSIWVEREGRKIVEQRRRADAIRKRPSPVVTGPAAIPQPQASVVIGAGDKEYV